MNRKVAILGAGLLGRFLALALHQKGERVTLFDRGSLFGSSSCSYAAAGMLSPIAESEESQELLTKLGCASIPLWEKAFFDLNEAFFFRRHGSLVLWHPQDRAEKSRLVATLKRCAEPSWWQSLDAKALGHLEPDLTRSFTEGVFLKVEGHVDNREALEALGRALQEAQLTCHWNQIVSQVEPHAVSLSGETHHFDEVVDCRGLDAKSHLSDLRGVRGDLFIVETDEVQLRHPVRILHPRYPLYLVPRRNGKFVIGATSFESEDRGPVTLRSTLELLSAAFSVHPGFSEARILESVTQLRPAFPHSLPEIRWTPGLTFVNGLYRNGVLLAPKLAQLVAQFLEADQQIPQTESTFASLFRKLES